MVSVPEGNSILGITYRLAVTFTFFHQLPKHAETNFLDSRDEQNESKWPGT